MATPEPNDEWIDRHGVDRSPDAEAQRIDDAYERYRDEQTLTIPELSRIMLRRCDGDKKRARVLVEAYLAGTSKLLPIRSK